MENVRSWITLDMQDTSSWIVINAKKGDDKREVCIRLTDGGVPYQIASDVRAVFSAQKADGNRIYNKCTIEGNVVRYQFTQQTCASEGVMSCEIKLYDDNGELLTSPRFGIYVEEPVFDDENIAESSYEFNALTDIVDKTVYAYLQENPVGVDDTLTIPGMAADAAAVGVRLANVAVKFDGNMEGQRVRNVGAPLADNDAATKAYADRLHMHFSVDLSASKWSGSAAPYTQKVYVDGVSASDHPHYGVVYSDNLTTKLAEKEAFTLVDDLDTADGTVTFSCFTEKPKTNLTILLEINRDGEESTDSGDVMLLDLEEGLDSEVQMDIDGTTYGMRNATMNATPTEGKYNFTVL